MVEAHIAVRRADRAVAPLASGDAAHIINDLVHQAVDFIVCTDGDGRIVYANHAWDTAVGQRGLPTALLADVVVDADGLVARFDTAPAGRVALTLAGADGQRIDVDGIVTTERAHGVPVLFRCIFRDVTERRRVDAARGEARRENER